MFGLIRGLFFAVLISSVVYFWGAAAASFVLLDPSMFNYEMWAEGARFGFTVAVTIISAICVCVSYLIWDEEEDERQRAQRFSDANVIRELEEKLAEAEFRLAQQQIRGGVRSYCSAYWV